jgi:N-methylhydantoinase B
MAPEPIRVSLLTDRHQHPALGFMGGMPGTPTKIALNDGQFIHPKSQTDLHPGDKLTINYPGGGGFGNPRERDRAAVEEDVREELISKEAAQEIYGQ